jgi:hypothetical protein
VLYKRNQLEDAIAGCVEPPTRSQPSQDLLNRLKRLLDTDRKLKKRPYAFYSGKPSGKGVEVEFSEYEVFALFTAVRLLDHGFPQKSVVYLLRNIRTALEKEHARILRLPSVRLFDQGEIQARARPGQLAATNQMPAFLVIAAQRQTGDGTARYSMGESYHICRSEADMMRAIKSRLGTNTIFETVSSAFLLHEQLTLTEPRRRGPSGGTK